MKLRLIDPPPWLPEPVVRSGRRVHRGYEVGDCWYATPRGSLWCMFADGPESPVDYRQPLIIASEHKEVTPMIVVIPSGEGCWPFSVHSPTLSEVGWGPKGWQVTGDLPGITVKPSINWAPGMAWGWHGWITDGEMR